MPTSLGRVYSVSGWESRGCGRVEMGGQEERRGEERYDTTNRAKGERSKK